MDYTICVKRLTRTAIRLVFLPAGACRSQNPITRFGGLRFYAGGPFKSPNLARRACLAVKDTSSTERVSPQVRAPCSKSASV